MPIVPADWMPECDMRYIVAHWTAGTYEASDNDQQHYHILVEGDGKLVRGDHSIHDNVSTSDDDYAAHVRGFNTKSIGISVCCMAGARENPFNGGQFPMLQEQWEVMARVAADLANRYGIPLAPERILAHGEVERIHNRPQTGKWDPLVLPWDPGVDKRIVGDRFRDRVRQHM